MRIELFLRALFCSAIASDASAGLVNTSRPVELRAWMTCRWAKHLPVSNASTSRSPLH